MVDKTLPKNPRRFYVYVIFRMDGTPCYVGKGQRDRYQVHYRRSNNAHLKRLSAAAGGRLPVVIVRDGLTDEEALATEIAFIAAIGRDIHGGPLVNFTDGGEGAAGYQHTEENKKRLSAATKGLPKRPGFGTEVSLRLKGVPKSPAHCAAIGRASTGRVKSEASRAKNSASQRGRKRPPRTAEHCAKISAAKLGVKHTAEHNAKIAAAGIGRRHSEETKRKMADSQRGTTKSPATKAKISAARRRNHLLRQQNERQSKLQFD